MLDRCRQETTTHVFITTVTKEHGIVEKSDGGIFGEHDWIGTLNVLRRRQPVEERNDGNSRFLYLGSPSRYIFI